MKNYLMALTLIFTFQLYADFRDENGVARLGGVQGKQSNQLLSLSQEQDITGWLVHFTSDNRMENISSRTAYQVSAVDGDSIILNTPDGKRMIAKTSQLEPIPISVKNMPIAQFKWIVSQHIAGKVLMESPSRIQASMVFIKVEDVTVDNGQPPTEYELQRRQGNRVVLTPVEAQATGVVLGSRDGPKKVYADGSTWSKTTTQKMEVSYEVVLEASFVNGLYDSQRRISAKEIGRQELPAR